GGMIVAAGLGGLDKTTEGADTQQIIKTALPELNARAVSIEILDGVQRSTEMLAGFGAIGRGTRQVVEYLLLEIYQSLGCVGKIFVVKMVFRMVLAGNAVRVSIGFYNFLNCLVCKLICI